jgi:hypothetical protein
MDLCNHHFFDNRMKNKVVRWAHDWKGEDARKAAITQYDCSVKWTNVLGIVLNSKLVNTKARLVEIQQ